jgi:S-adenosyl-L-methionine hydrolase (adenosine-forming)
VAAAVCTGVELGELGDDVDPSSLVPGLIPVVREEDGELVADVLWIDRFGNCQLNVDPDDLDGWGDRIRLRIDGQPRVARRVGAYAEIGAGEVGLIVDSYGLIAVALDRRSAHTELGLGPGQELRLGRLDGDDDTGVTSQVQLGPRRDGDRP